MKKYLLLFAFLLTALCFSGCLKDSMTANSTTNTTTVDPAAQAATDDALIQAALKASNTTATKDPSGVYYKIVTPGTGAYPTVNSTISISYTGKLLDGTTFDSSTGASFLLSTLIKGWQIGVPYINTGGTILLFIPSAYGYGTAAVGTIPANSVLVFSITLNSFK